MPGAPDLEHARAVADFIDADHHELVDIANRLHNTALHRVNRCSSAHELTAHTGFLGLVVLD